jgi:hypothetical protein
MYYNPLELYLHTVMELNIELCFSNFKSIVGNIV